MKMCEHIATQVIKHFDAYAGQEYVLKKVLRMNDADIDEMNQQIRKELDTDPMDGGVDIPDGGDGITRYPQDGGGGIVTPDQMPDYEEPEENGNDDDPVEDDFDKSLTVKGKKK